MQIVPNPLLGNEGLDADVREDQFLPLVSQFDADLVKGLRRRDDQAPAAQEGSRDRFQRFSGGIKSDLGLIVTVDPFKQDKADIPVFRNDFMEKDFSFPVKRLQSFFREQLQQHLV